MITDLIKRPGWWNVYQSQRGPHLWAMGPYESRSAADTCARSDRLMLIHKSAL